MSGSAICRNEEQPEKAEEPIDVTVSGIASCLKEEQPEKAELEIDVRPQPNTTFVTPVQL